MDASVSTRVVSWNDAAEMNESVESDAFVIPSSSGPPAAGRPPAAITRVLFREPEAIHHGIPQPEYWPPANSWPSGRGFVELPDPDSLFRSAVHLVARLHAERTVECVDVGGRVATAIS